MFDNKGTETRSIGESKTGTTEAAYLSGIAGTTFARMTPPPDSSLIGFLVRDAGPYTSELFQLSVPQAAPQRRSATSVEAAQDLIELPRSADLDSVRNVETSRPRTDIESVIAIRNAFKLGAKFFGRKDVDVGAQQISLCEHAFDVGLILLLAGESRNLVVAGILNNSFVIELQKGSHDIRAIVERKFGAEVVRLIDSVTPRRSSDEPWGWALKELEALDRLHGADKDSASLACAIKIDLLATANQIFDERIGPSVSAHNTDPRRLLTRETDPAFLIADLICTLKEFERIGVSDVLVAQFKAEAFEFAERTVGAAPEIFRLDRAEVVAREANIRSPLELPTLLADLHAIRLAAEISSKYFEKIPRKWGPVENIPLSMHEFEVGTLLALAGERRDVIIAGLLHDFFEGYITGTDIAVLKDEVRRLFGERVVRIIEAVTEPGKNQAGTSWWERKLEVLTNLAWGDHEIASVVCAAKISTLAAGNKFLYMERPIAEWSSGSMDDNLRLYRLYLQHFIDHQVSPILMEQYQLELRRFETHCEAALDDSAERAVGSKYPRLTVPVHARGRAVPGKRVKQN